LLIVRRLRPTSRLLAATCATWLLGCESTSTGDHDAGDASAADAGVDAADADVEASVPTYPMRYPSDRTLSPIDAHVARGLREIVTRGEGAPDVFIKVGASASQSTSFLYCFAGNQIDLDGRAHLEDTLAHFRAGTIESTTPFNRASLATLAGRGAAWAITGDPSPLEQELAVANPRYAVLMYGTNDIEQTNVFAYANSLLDITDALLEAGVIPMWTTIMPRDDNATSDLEVPVFNLAMRAVAQARQVPLIDFHRELMPLPEHGLGADDIHPSTSPEGACKLDAAGLTYGYNVRNLITLETLDRVRAVVEGSAPPDAPGVPLAGMGTHALPFIIDTFPFTHVASTLFSTEDAIDAYPGCAASQNESGNERVYAFTLDAQATLRFLVFDRGTVDIDAHLLDGPSGADCIARDHQDLEVTLGPGTYRLVLDTFVDGGGIARAGEYVVVAMRVP
jgi:hypothetical protein